MALLPRLPKPILGDESVKGSFLKKPRQAIKDFFKNTPVARDALDAGLSAVNPFAAPGEKEKSKVALARDVFDKVVPEGDTSKSAKYSGTPIADIITSNPSRLIPNTGLLPKSVNDVIDEKISGYFKPTEKVRVRDVIREIPDSVAKLGTDVLQSIARNLNLVGKSAVTNDINAKLEPKTRLEEILTGIEKGDEFNYEKEGRDVASIVGQGDKISPHGAMFLGVLSAGSDALGLGPEKGAAKTAALNIAKETAPDIIKTIAKDAFPELTDNILESIVPKLVKETTPEGVEKIIKQAHIAKETETVINDAPEILDEIRAAKQEVPTPGVPPVAQDAEAVVDTAKNDEAVSTVVQALRDAKPIRRGQEAIYSAERSKRLGQAMAAGDTVKGEAGFKAQLSKLKGEIPKVEFESLKNKLPQETVDHLFDMTRTSDSLSGFEKIRAQEGLAKLFGEYGGQVPTKSEIALLERVFPGEMIDELIAKRPLLSKFSEAGLQLVNIPRSLMSSFDLSFGLRQGIFAAPKYRKQFWDSWKSQFKIFGSERAYKAAQEALHSNADFALANEAGISFTDIGRTLSNREEDFASQWAERIPGVGKLIRASGRAYTAFANKYRMDIFSQMIKDAEKLGLNPKQDMDQLKNMADFINSATGRGSLRKLEEAAPVLNAFFFSPRLIASRLDLLTKIAQPGFWMKVDPFTRKETLKTLFTYAGTMVSTLALLDQIPGVEVGVDPTSADFGKVKIGKTRLDITGGFQQYIRMAAQLITGKYTSTTSGITKILGEGYKPLTRYDIILRQIESKEAPIPSFITSILRQQDYAGNPVDAKKEILNRVTPILAQDIVTMAKESPELLPLQIPAFFGVGVQTYDSKPKSDKDTGKPRPGTLPRLPSPPRATVGKLPRLPKVKLPSN